MRCGPWKVGRAAHSLSIECQRHRRALLAALGFFLSAGAIAAGGGHGARQAPTQPTFRAGIDLVTIDAVVVDDHGRHVTDLTAADFEVTESGRVRPIQQLAHVGSDPRPSPRDAGPAGGGDGLASLGPVSGTLRPDEVGRTLAIVVDDLGLSFESTVYARQALGRFIDEQLTPGDLVAIIRTAGGAGVLQQFTTDRRVLHAAADAVQWSAGSRRYAGRPDSIAGAAGADAAEGLHDDLYTTASLEVLRAAVEGLRRLPGRKAITFLSEGFDLFEQRNEPRVRAALDRLMDEAHRAGVVLYAVDARGLEYAEPGAALRALHRRQESLRFLAQQTGGFAVLDNNDLARGLARTLDDQRGYYLLGFEPAQTGPGSRLAGRIRLRVTRPGLHVRWRRAAFGPAASRGPETAADALALAARSPFAAADVTLRLTALFGHDRSSGPYIHSLLLLDPGDLAFAQTGGLWRADIEVLVVTVGDNGRIAGEWRRDVRLSLDEAGHRHIREHGIVYRAVTRLAASGPYQVRAAVRDRATGQLGSAAQFLLVPQAGRGRLAASSVLMRHDSGPGEASREPGLVLGEPTVRVFRRGQRAIYAFEIYDGLRRGDAVVTSTAVLREGKVLSRTPWTAVPAPGGEDDVRVIPAGGRLTLGADFTPGDYVLEVTVARRRDKGRHDKVTSQWTTFEVR